MTEDFIEAFVSTIIAFTLIMIGIRILFPDLGAPLVGIIPDVVGVLIYLFVGLFIGALLYKLVEET